MAEPGNVAGRPRRSFFKAFKPLLIWSLISGVLLGAYYHTRFLKETTVVFTALLDGNRPDVPYTVTLNGKPYRPGERTMLGPKTLVIEGVEIEPVTKTFFVWYRINNLGDIRLTRAKGSLQVDADPSPKEIQVLGARVQRSAFARSLNLTDLPVGEYRVVAVYDLFQEEQRVWVARNETAQAKVRARAGTVEVSADPADAKFRVSGRSPFVNLEGTTPQTVLLPAGQYQLSVWRDDYARNFNLDVTAGSSERKLAKFVYGQVKLITTPAGASVRWNRREAGKTPLSVSELKPGDYQFRLELAEYLPATVEVKVTGEDPITVITNLVNRDYANALDRARRELSRSRPNHRSALASIEEALKVTPDSAEALEVKASIESALKAEETRAAEEQAKRLAAQPTQRQVARTTQQPETAAVAPNQAASALAPAARVMSKRDMAASQFAKVTEADKNNASFDTYEWSFAGDLERMRAAIVRTFGELDARWKLQSQRGVGSGSYLFLATGATPPSDDPSHCTVLASQVAPNETVVFAKFSEYALNKKLGLKILIADTASKWIPIHADYYQTNKVGAADQHRAARADSFKSTLQRFIR